MSWAVGLPEPGWGGRAFWGVYTDLSAGALEGQVPREAFHGPPKKRQGVVVRKEEGEPGWALPASSLLGSARWDGQLYCATLQAPGAWGKPAWMQRGLCRGRGDSNRHQGPSWRGEGGTPGWPGLRRVKRRELGACVEDVGAGGQGALAAPERLWGPLALENQLPCLDFWSGSGQRVGIRS